MAKITYWNSEKGFGFVQTEDGSAFLYCSKILPTPPRGYDLTGREVDKVQTEMGEKGLKVTFCALVANGEPRWFTSCDDIGVERAYFDTSSSKTDKLYFTVFEREDPKDRYSKPIFQKENVRKAAAEGCPQRILKQGVRGYMIERREWYQRVEGSRAYEEAKNATKALTREMGDGKIVLIFSADCPKPTQWLNDETINQFNELWEKFVSGLKIAGSNRFYQWAIVPEGDYKIHASYGYSSMGYSFQSLDFRSWGRKVFRGSLTCGERSPHSGGRHGMVGANPNDPQFRNRD